MASPSPQHQLWHVSRGIVFASGGRAIYPRLPVAGYHSSPDLLSERDDSMVLANEGLSLDANHQVRSSTTVARGVDAKARATSLPQPGTETPEAGVLDAAAEAPAIAGAGFVDEDAFAEQPYTPLDFRIPEDVFREAKLAQSFWSYNLYRRPGDDGPDGKVKVHYCKTKHTTERVLQQYFMDEKILGFDLEWASDATKLQSARRNVSLVQIASQSRIALFHIALYPKTDDLVAPSLKKIMEDPEITKAGVCIKGDCTRLKNYMGIECKGIFELSHLYKLVKYSTTREYGAINRRTVSLATQVRECLGLPMFKGQDVRASDWSQSLGMQQIEYSASDAYAAVQIYGVLDHQRKQLDPTPPLPHHAELNRPISLADGVIIPPPDETLEPEGEDVRAGALNLSRRYLNSLGDSIQIEEDGEPILKETPALPPAPARDFPKDASIIVAEDWLQDYRGGNSIVKAFPGALRAYHMWHYNPDLNPEAIAKLLRNPPLQTATVVNYILEAIRLERLPYDAARLEHEVLSFFPKDALPPRYKHLASACKQVTGAATSGKA
ncbi:3'-5' exonuclease [Coniochaeta hoffmannii]|uniref:3'-5' exonuclease n=1 Tax=Coniochaeta hoffmannii TaxID=91930 RepID=A0AA38RWA2_9PEZI|nr:3'-5' exonuclease [Coniochaeta hoffmannii]